MLASEFFGLDRLTERIRLMFLYGDRANFNEFVPGVAVGPMSPDGRVAANIESGNRANMDRSSYDPDGPHQLFRK